MDANLVALFVVPGAFALVAALPKRRSARFAILALASLCYWALLIPYAESVSADGPPWAMAAVLGWAIGLVIPILPVYFIARGIQWRMTVAQQRGLRNKDTPRAP